MTFTKWEITIGAKKLSPITDATKAEYDESTHLIDGWYKIAKLNGDSFEYADPYPTGQLTLIKWYSGTPDNYKLEGATQFYLAYIQTGVKS